MITSSFRFNAHREHVPPEVFQQVEQLTQESSVLVGGLVTQDQRAPDGYELQLQDLKVYQVADEWPIHPSDGIEVITK